MKISLNNRRNAGSSVSRSATQVTTFITVLRDDLLPAVGNNESFDLSLAGC